MGKQVVDSNHTLRDPRTRNYSLHVNYSCLLQIVNRGERVLTAAISSVLGIIAAIAQTPRYKHVCYLGFSEVFSYNYEIYQIELFNTINKFTKPICFRL